MRNPKGPALSAEPLRKIVDDIEFYPNYLISFDQAVQKLGPPDGRRVRPLTPETKGCTLLATLGNKRLVLQKIDPVTGIFNFAPDLCEQFHDLNGKLPRGLPVENVNCFAWNDKVFDVPCFSMERVRQLVEALVPVVHSRYSDM